MSKLYLRTLTLAEYNQAADNIPVLGHILEKPAWIEGCEEEDLSRHVDCNTEYRKFTQCDIYIAKTISEIREGIYYYKLQGKTVWIYY